MAEGRYHDVSADRRSKPRVGDVVIACILANGDARPGGNYLSTHYWADFLRALEARGWEIVPREETA